MRISTKLVRGQFVAGQHGGGICQCALLVGREDGDRNVVGVDNDSQSANGASASAQGTPAGAEGVQVDAGGASSLTNTTTPRAASSYSSQP